MVFPYLYMLLQSLAPWDEVNSLFVTTSDTVVRVAVAALAGYALAVVNFRGKKTLNNIILFQMFYPGIMLPVSSSITTVIFLFLFMQRWVELLWDMLVVKDPQRQTLNVLLATMFGPYGSYPGPLYAAGVLLTFPILVLFALFSKRFVEGVQFTLR